MSDIAIKVENLSKRYRIGLKEEMHDTFAGALSDFVRRPWRNLRNLRRLTTFSQNGQEEAADILWALRDVSFEVKRGEVIGIIGRNGAGKSTLLKVVSRITEPTSGRVVLNGRVASLLEVGTGFHPELTGRENVYLNGVILGMRRREVDRKFDEIVDFAGVEKFIDTPVKRYSSGMQVRLAFAVAAFLEPEILVVDEVLAVGDLSFQKRCLQKMESISEGGRTVLFVSHSMASIDRLCERCILLDGGKIRRDGVTAVVIEDYVRLSGSEISSEYVQKPNPDKPIHLRRVAIRRGEREGVTAVTYDDEFQIVIEYEVNHRAEGLNVAFALLTSTGVILMSSAEHDLSPELLSVRDVGVYQTSVTIPANLLNVGQYTIRVFTTDSLRSIAYDRVEAIRFSVIGTGTHVGVGKRAAHLVPLLKWTTTDCP